MNVHLDGKHSQLYEKNFDCHHCSRRFIFKTSLNSHVYKLQLRKQLVCKFCSLKVSKTEELNEHVLQMHPESGDNNSKENPSWNALHESIKTEGPKPGTKFNEKPKCDLCNLECQDLGAVKEHKFVKHQDGTFKCCTYCDYKIKGWYNLRRHIECDHPEHGE